MAGIPATTEAEPAAAARFAIADLSEAERQFLLARTNRHAALHLAIHGGLVVIVGALIQARVPYWPVLMLPQGILIMFLFCAMHEAIHRTAFRSRWINDVVSSVCGWLVALPAVWFRYFHIGHHRFTNLPDRDPELAVAKPATRLQYLWQVSALPIWWARVRVLSANAMGRNKDPFMPNKAKAAVAVEARCYLALYALVLVVSFALGSDLLLWTWILPAALGQPFLRAYLAAEHTGCPEVPDMFANTRTTYTNALVRFIAWNMPYHVEHHAFQVVPFHKLPAFHRHTRPYLQVTEHGYLNVHREIWAGLK